MRITSVGRTALWVGLGGFFGIAVGALFTNAERARELAGAWTVVVLLYVGMVVLFTRERDAAAPAAAAHAAHPVPVVREPPASGERLAVVFDLPDIPAGFPAVMGRGDPLHVRVVARRAGRPAEGAAVQLTATMEGESLQGDGITGTDGSVEFTLEPESVGELRLHADAKVGRHAGEAHGSVSIVNYDEEIGRLFGEFRAFAHSVLGPEAHADTARELADKLRVRADAASAKALLELARVYELVAYGERAADRRLYLAVLEQLMVLEKADMPGAPASGALSREA